MRTRTDHFAHGWKSARVRGWARSVSLTLALSNPNSTLFSCRLSNTYRSTSPNKRSNVLSPKKMLMPAITLTSKSSGDRCSIPSTPGNLVPFGHRKQSKHAPYFFHRRSQWVVASAGRRTGRSIRCSNADASASLSTSKEQSGPVPLCGIGSFSMSKWYKAVWWQPGHFGAKLNGLGQLVA